MKSKNIILFILLALSFGSCKDNKSVITILGESNASLNSIVDIRHEFTKLNGDSIIALGFEYQESMEKANFEFARGGHKYDIVMQYNLSLSSFVRNKYIVDLQSLNNRDSIDALQKLENSFFDKAWKEVGYYYMDPSKPSSGHIKVGYPFATNTMIMVYNKEMFENEDNQRFFYQKYGYALEPPHQWESIYDVAEFFTNKEKGTYGLCMQGDAGWLYYEWALFAFGMNGGVMDKEYGWEGDLSTPFLLTSENTKKATELYVNMKSFNKGDFYNVDPKIQLDLIKEGNVAFSFVWTDWLYSAFYDEISNEYDNRFGFTVLPGSKSPLAGGAFFINKNSKNIEESYELIKWLLKKDNQIKMIQKGLSSPRRDAYESPYVQHIPYVGAIKSSLDRGVYMYEATPEAILIQNKITEWVQKTWRGETSVNDALSTAYDEIIKERVEVYENLGSK